MYSVGLLIVERETARRRLLYVFEIPDGTLTNGFRTQPIPDGPHSIGLLTRLKTPSHLPRADTGGASSSLPTAKNRTQSWRLTSDFRSKPARTAARPNDLSGMVFGKALGQDNI